MSACWELLRSEAFFLLLSNFTGLRLHYLCPADDNDDEDKDEGKEKEKEEDSATGSSTEAQSADTSREKGVRQFVQPVQLCVCACVYFL